MQSNLYCYFYARYMHALFFPIYTGRQSSAMQVASHVVRRLAIRLPCLSPCVMIGSYRILWHHGNAPQNMMHEDYNVSHCFIVCRNFVYFEIASNNII